MGRCTVTRWAFVAGLLCFCGCTGPQTFSPFGWMRGSDSSAPPATAAKSNPLKPSDQVATDTDSPANPKDGSKAGDETAAADGKGAGPHNNGFKADTLDPALRKLMDDELASEAPDERQRLFNQWSKFDAAFIRELVENHRMARETAENRQHPVKLASAESVQRSSAQAADFDQPAPDSSSGRSRPAMELIDTPPTKASPPAAGSAVSPWSDSGDMPVVPTSPAASATAGNKAAGPAGPGAADAFDSPNSPANPGQPINIVPSTSATPPSKTASASSSPAPPAAAAPPANPAVPSGKADAFAGMTPLDDNLTSARSPAPVAPPISAAPAPSVPPSSPAQASSGPQVLPGPPAVPAGNAATAKSDGILIQPGVAAPASVISSLQAARNAGGSGSADAASLTPSLDAPAPIRTVEASGPPTTAGDSAQPVTLQPPTDLPSAAGASPAKAGGKPTLLADAQAAAPGGSAGSSPSALAGLGNRLFGAINPNLASAARNAVQSANWQDELQKIVTVAAAEASHTSVGTTDAEKLKYVEKQVHLRMLYLLAGQPAKSLEPISGVDAPDQEFWQQVFWGVSNYFDKSAMADPTDRATQTVTQLRTAVHRLQEKSKLELRNVAFCQKIVNYGNYERVKRDEFTPGQMVLLYAEVENFKSEPTTDGPYRTILKSTIEIIDSHGQAVQSMPFPPTDDLCANPRRDYYNSYEFAIPQRIGLGPHTLKLTVEDQVSRKLATYTVNFTVK